MTETQQINTVLRQVFSLPLTPAERMTLFFAWGMMQPLDERATEEGIVSGAQIGGYRRQRSREKSTSKAETEKEGKTNG